MKLLVVFFLLATLSFISTQLADWEDSDQDVIDDLLEQSDKLYTPDWDSLDTRPLPSWYDEAKFGIFIHWGVFSVPSFGEWFWYEWREGNPEYVNFMKKNYPPGFTYSSFASQFRAEFFDPNQWAKVLESSGAKYVVLTSKHHEGFTLWPSKYSWNWNSVDIGPKRDLVGDLAKAIRKKTKMRFGLYHSMYEWYHPLYLQDKANHFKTQDFVRTKTMPELYELVNKYKPEVIWSDGDWEASDKYWDSLNFLAWLYNESPVRDTVVVNDRWGQNVWCQHGDFVNCKDKYNPGVVQTRKWENAMTIDRYAWAFRRNAQLEDFLTTQELIETLVTTVSCGGKYPQQDLTALRAVTIPTRLDWLVFIQMSLLRAGNLLMNIGPTADGMIRPIFQERLLDVGSWLQVNGQAIFGTHPWILQNDTLTSSVWYTTKRTTQTVIYAISLRWPENNTLMLGAQIPLTDKSIVTLLGHDDPLKWDYNKGVLFVKFPEMDQVTGRFAWTVQLAL